MPNRCQLQSLLAVSATVPVYTITENLIKWRTDLQNKTLRFIENVEKLRSGYELIWDFHNSRQLPTCTVAAMEDSTLSI